MRRKRRSNATDRFVGRRVRFFRLAKGWSQTRLAAELDLSFQQIQKYENAIDRVSCSNLVVIAKALCQPLTAFFPPENQTETGALFELVDTSQSLRLLRAFNRVASVSTRAAMLDLVEQMADKTAMSRQREVA
jgi:transcriptional regulator with XRE-family HTH domain